MISIVIPTIAGREAHFERCLAAYEDRSASSIQIIVERDHPAVGPAWNAGAARATGEYLHLTADDLEPHEGWDVAAIAAVEAGYLPAPRVTNQLGRLDSCGLHGVEMENGAHVPMSVVPFLPMTLWGEVGPVLPIHYFTDNWISWRAARAGWSTRVRRDFAFTHHWAEHGRGAGMTYEQRMAHDQAVYLAAVEKEGVPGDPVRDGE